ncbi:MAG: glycosylhydrolase-like jelly roll fold domain-containing protein, partial [Candidatus Cryptobacteroides sp.]
PSMKGYPECDEIVRTISARMWKNNTEPFSRSVRYGKGRIYKDASLEQIFADLGIVPDFVADDSQLPLQFIHLRLSDGEYYFVSNQGDKAISFDGIFRVTGKTPELWNPLTKEVRDLTEYRTLTGAVKIPMQLEAYESSFIVFRKDTDKASSEGCNYPARNVLETLDTPWTVAFEAGRGGHETPVVFETLYDWTTSDDYKIKYFSGNATYSNTFKLKKLPKEDVYIDLGKVMVMAKVKINGEYAGGVWTAPYRLNITEFLRKGVNTVEIEVVNCWRNRLIGEKEAVPEAERFTFQTSTYLNKDSNLQPSGLLGPVQIQTCNYSE